MTSFDTCNVSKTIFNLNKSRDETKYIHRNKVSYHVFGVETAYKCKLKQNNLFYKKNYI